MVSVKANRLRAARVALEKALKLGLGPAESKEASEALKGLDD